MQARASFMKEEIPAVENPNLINTSHGVQPKNLRILMVFHAVITFAAAVVLIVAPALIPSAVGINLESGAYLICYLLAAAELSIAFLSWSGRTVSDVRALRVIVISFIVFHAASGVLEIYALTKGVSAFVWGNVAVRVIVVVLFAYYGLYKMLNKPA